MRRHPIFLAALLGTLLLALPAQSQAFFGFFGGGFSFGFGSGWGGPGWWGPGYSWYRPYSHYWYRPYLWRRPYYWRYYRPYRWGYPFVGLTLPHAYVPQVLPPAAQAPATSQEK
jgi:hypothetical protein